MTAWQIKPASERVELNGGRAEVVFTVSNPGPVDRRATLDFLGSEQSQASWFTVAEPQLVVPHGGSAQFVASVTPGAQAAPGTYWLSGRVYSADAAPEEDSTISDRVAFEVKGAPPKPPTKWWLWALIAGTVLAVVIGAVVFLVVRGGGWVAPAVIGMKQAEAERTITDSGLVSKAVVKPNEKEAGVVIGQDPAGGTDVAQGSTLTITVSRGPLGEHEVELPDFVGMKMIDLFNAQVEFGASVFPRHPSPRRGGFTLDEIMAGRPSERGALKGISMDQLAAMKAYGLGFAIQTDPTHPTDTDQLDPKLAGLVGHRTTS